MLLPSLSNVNALIVGATQGIGLGFAQQLSVDDRITHLFATYRSEQPPERLSAVAEQSPDRVHLIRMDITDEEQIEQGVADMRAILLRRGFANAPNLHIAINCVGLLHNDRQQPEKALRQLNPENLLAYFQVNSIGPALLAKHLLGPLKHSEPSLFATISAKIGSIGDNRIGGWYGYRASKAALNMFLKTAAIEYSRRSPKTIIVMLHPGTTDTRLSKPFQRGVPPEKLFSTERTVTQLLSVLENVTIKDSGEFFSWDGSRLPW